VTREEILSMPAGRDLDVLVAEKVMGQCQHRDGYTQDDAAPFNFYGLTYACKSPGCNHRVVMGPGQRAVLTFGPPEYSTDIAAAWEAVDAIRSKGVPDAAGRTVRSAVRILCDDNEALVDIGRSVSAHALTVPLAVCRAALLFSLSRLDPA
jgi:hypothetical protein